VVEDVDTGLLYPDSSQMGRAVSSPNQTTLPSPAPRLLQDGQHPNDGIAEQFFYDSRARTTWSMRWGRAYAPYMRHSRRPPMVDSVYQLAMAPRVTSSDSYPLRRDGRSGPHESLTITPALMLLRLLNNNIVTQTTQHFVAISHSA
jgi:hypothetical protein